MGDEETRSGIHLTGEDSGWPVADPEEEPDPVKDGSGEDPHPSADQIEPDGTVKTDVGNEGGTVTTDDDSSTKGKKKSD